MFSNPKRLVWCALAFLILGGLLLRAIHLGTFGFWTDELFHVFAARSYLENHNFLIPIYGNYTRALPVTYLTALSFQILGESETAARLPFMLFNLLTIVLGFVMVRRIFSDTIALVFAGVMSFSPLAIELSRECRMYTIFQFFYFLMAMLFVMGFEHSSDKKLLRLPGILHKAEKHFQMDLSLLALSVLSALASLRFHSLTYNFSFVLAAYAGVMMLVTLRRQGFQAAFSSKYFLLLAGMFGALAFLIFFRNEFFHKMLETALEVPVWSTYPANNFHYYRNMLSKDYPAMLFLYPLGAFFLVKHYGRKGLFVMLSFVVLMLMHSLVFGRRGNRYIFYIFPFFLMGAGAALEILVPAVVSALRNLVRDSSQLVRMSVLLLSLPAVNVLCYPWLGNAKNISRRPIKVDIKSLSENWPEKDSRYAVMTTHPAACHYYFNREPEYCFVNEPGRPAAGQVFVKDAQDLREALKNHQGLYLITDQGHFHNNAFLSEEMRAIVKTQMKTLPHKGDQRILIFAKEPRT